MAILKTNAFVENSNFLTKRGQNSFSGIASLFYASTLYIHIWSKIRNTIFNF
jgi:hypothetical protein